MYTSTPAYLPTSFSIFQRSGSKTRSKAVNNVLGSLSCSTQQQPENKVIVLAAQEYLVMWYSVLSYLVPPNMSTFTCGKKKFLTTEEVAAIFENRKSVDPDDETEFSGSIPAEIVSEASSQGEASSRDEASSQGESSSPFEVSDEDSEPDMNGCLEQTPTGNDDSDFEDLGVEPPYKKVRIDSERQRLGCEDNVRGRGRGRGRGEELTSGQECGLGRGGERGQERSGMRGSGRERGLQRAGGG